MSNKNYLEDVFEDVMNLIDDEIDVDEFYDEEDEYFNENDFRDRLEEACYGSDVTGNMSGSHYCNSCKAQEMVFTDTDAVTDALREFGYDGEAVGKFFLEQNFEALDVIAREYVLPEAIEKAVDEVSGRY